MRMTIIAFATLGPVALAAPSALAEPSTHNSSLAKAVRGVKAECGEIHDPNSTSFLYPPTRAIALARCQTLRGDLCWAEDHAMGGRWSRELICTQGSVALGGFPTTYKQGQNR